jgi:hypothetical protein
MVTSRLLRGGLRRSKVWEASAATRQRQLRFRLRRQDPEGFVVFLLCSGSTCKFVEYTIFPQHKKTST